MLARDVFASVEGSQKRSISSFISMGRGGKGVRGEDEVEEGRRKGGGGGAGGTSILRRVWVLQRARPWYFGGPEREEIPKDEITGLERGCIVEDREGKMVVESGGDELDAAEEEETSTLTSLVFWSISYRCFGLLTFSLENMLDSR